MNITCTPRGYDRELSSQTFKPVFAVNRDGPTRIFTAADVGVEMWDFYHNDCTGLSAPERNAKLSKEFMMGQAQLHNYMKLAILLNDDKLFVAIQKSCVGGIEYVINKHGHRVDLKAYFSGLKKMPF
jgi:hypothetical protein